jgi:hypothetical protein
LDACTFRAFDDAIIGGVDLDKGFGCSRGNNGDSRKSWYLDKIHGRYSLLRGEKRIGDHDILSQRDGVMKANFVDAIVSSFKSVGQLLYIHKLSRRLGGSPVGKT